MIPARTAKRLFDDTRLMVVRSVAAGGIVGSHGRPACRSVGGRRRPVMNNRSGTLPSSFKGLVTRTGEKVEIRLAFISRPGSTGSQPMGSDGFRGRRLANSN